MTASESGRVRYTRFWRTLEPACQRFQFDNVRFFTAAEVIQEMPQKRETRYEHRTDSVEEKLRLLRTAHQEGNYDVAMSLSESIKYTLTLERQSEAPKARAAVGAGSFGEVAELPRSWSEWARGWLFYKALALRETQGLDRSREPIDVRIDFRADPRPRTSSARFAWRGWTRLPGRCKRCRARSAARPTGIG